MLAKTRQPAHAPMATKVPRGGEKTGPISLSPAMVEGGAMRGSVLLILLAAPVASAVGDAPMEARFSSLGSLTVDGALDVDARLAGIVYEGGAEGSVRMAFEEADVWILHETWLAAGTGQVGPIDPVRGRFQVLPSQEPIEETSRMRFQGNVTVFPLGDHPVVRVMPEASTLSARLAAAGVIRFEIPTEDEIEYNPWAARYPLRMHGPTAGVHATDFEVLPEQRLVLYAFNARVVLQNSTSSRAFYTGMHETMVGPDAARAGKLELVSLLVVGVPSEATLTGPAWSPRVRSIQGSVQGAIALVGTEGTAWINGTKHDGKGVLLQATGDFQIRGGYATDGRADWTITGDVERFVIDGETRWAAPAGAVLGSLFIVAVAWKILALVLGANRADPLSSSTRKRMLRLIASRPGITRIELVEALGVTRHTVAFHVRNLLTHELIDVYKEGRYEHYQLDSGSLRLRIPVEGGIVNLRRVLAATQHPIRKEIYERLRGARRAMTYDQLLQDWPQAPRASLLSFHVKRLEDAGAIRRARHQGRTLLEATVDATEYLPHQAQVLTSALHADELLAWCRQRPAMSLDLLASRASQAGFGAKKKVKRRIEMLRSMNLLEIRML